MTKEQEVRAKPMELAIQLIGLAVDKNAATIVKDRKIGMEPVFIKDAALGLFDDVKELGEKFGAFILAAP